VRMLLADVIDLLLDAGYGEVDTWSDIARTVGRTSTET
jgi:O6-methylguanine-DNA--protein-cysteine methyltransferase